MRSATDCFGPLVLGVLAGCAGPRLMNPDTTASGAIETRSGPTTDSAPRVDLLARQFLGTREQERPDFAYYCYLLFDESSARTLGARTAAARSFVSLFSDVSEAARYVPYERMAVLLAPVSGSARDSGLVRDPALLVERYDYVRARLWANGLERVGAEIPSVAIVGVRRPLSRVAAPAAADVVVVDLDLDDPALIERRILELRSALESRDDELREGSEHLVLHKLRGFFTAIGLSVAQLSSLFD